MARRLRLLSTVLPVFFGEHMSDRASFTTEEMQEYWKSEEWTKMKADLFVLRGGKCERCGKTLGSTFVPHHLSYDHFKEETAEDLQLLCMRCHAEVHGKVVPSRQKPGKKNVKTAKKAKKKSAASLRIEASYQQALSFIASFGNKKLNERVKKMHREQVIKRANKIREKAEILKSKGLPVWNATIS